VAERDHPKELESLAESALDGEPVDWVDAESHASDADRGVVRQLRLVSAIAQVHRTAGSEDFSDEERSPALPLPSRWGPLEVREHVGRGSFGDVYRAWDLRLDREVALKLLHHDSEDQSSTIIDEGRLLARVRHPNVVTIHGADRIGRRVGLWMEFIRGQTLETLLAERGTFGAQEALLIGVDLCRALSAVHRAGVVHRDVKAQNVIREDGGRVVLMDFGTGLERSLGAGEPTLSGTPLYLAPELFEGTPATRQSDIYSLGVLLFHLVTQSYPIPGRSIAEVRAAHAARRRLWLRDLRPDLPERFVQTIEPALAVDPGARYQSAGEMEQALLAALPELDDSSHSRADPMTGRGTGARTLRMSRWSPRAISMGIATTVALAIGASMLGPRIMRKLAGEPGTPSPSSPLPGAAVTRELTARRVSLPATTFVGRPSPDGRYLSYVDLNGDLCLHEFATGQNRRLTNKGQSEEGAESQIAISSNGKQIAYSWHTLDGTNEIRLVGEDGAWPRLLFRRPDVTFPNPLQWSADGTQILTLLELAHGGSQLVLLSPADGSITPLRTFAGTQPHPALSLDGTTIAFQQVQQSDPRARDILAIDVRNPGAPPRPIVEHPSDDLFPFWAADGRLLFFSDRSGSLGLWTAQVDQGHVTGEPELLVRDVGRLAMLLGLTADGALYYYLQNGMVDVFTQTIDPLVDAPPGRAQPVEPTLVGSNISSEWSPDGRYLAYVSTKGLVQNDRYSRSLVIVDTQTGTRRHLQLPLNSFIAPRWAPDARTILVRGIDLEDREGIFAVDVATGNTRPAILFPAGGVQSATFAWSADGKAIWYDKPGARAIVAQELVGGRETIILEYASQSIQRLMQWPGFRRSPDDASIAYTGFTFEKNVGGSVVYIRTPGGATVELARATVPDQVEFQDWMPDGRAVLLIKRNTKERRNMLYEARIDGAPLRPLGVTMPAIRDLSMRRDGKTITYTAGMNSLEVWVLERFLTSTGSGTRTAR
jgi:serine/threonine-protein kinase